MRSILRSRSLRTGALVAATGAVLVAGVATAATAAPHAADKARSFHSTASPHTGVKPGQTITVKGKGAFRSTYYWCAQIIVHGSRDVSHDSTAVLIKSTKHGQVTCKQTFEPFSGKNHGHTRHCPTTRADRKAGWSCAIAIGDASTQGERSNSVAKFSAKR